MARPKRARKMTDQGLAKTLWLRLGTVQLAEREARRAGVSLSVFTDEALRHEIARREEERRAPVVAVA